MINEANSESPFPTSGAGLSGTSGMNSSGLGTSGLGTSGMGSSGMGTSGMASAGSATAADSTHNTVSRVAQRAHEAVDRMEQALGSGSERMMDWQQEYGDLARDQVRANPLAAVGVAFLAGLVFGRVLMR